MTKGGNGAKGKGKGQSKSKDGKKRLRWVPKENRRNSLLSAYSFKDFSDVLSADLIAVGGRMVDLHTSSELLGPLECLLIEPMGKRLGGEEYVSTGVVICLDGMPPTEDTLKQWCEAVAVSGWTDMGVSIAIPNVQMSSALEKADLEAVVDAVFATVGLRKCILVGKGWGAQRAVEIAAAESETAECVEGMILVGPSSPVPPECDTIDVPVLLLWAQDDNVSPMEEGEPWLEALDARPGPTTLKELEKGGHRFDAVMALDGVAEAVKNFIVSALLIANLQEEEEHEEQQIDSDEEPAHQQAKRRSQVLSSLLPSFLRQDVDCAEFQDGELVPEAAHRRSDMDADRRMKKRLSIDLPQWIHAGMVTASE